VRRSLRITVIWAALLSGCASAGGTAGSFDMSSVWYKHPTTGLVKECGGGFYPGVTSRRYNCGKSLQAQGYVEVEKCAKVPANALCVTDAEIRIAEEVERGQPSTGRAWVLWLPVVDSGGQPLPNQWSPLRLFDYRQDCEVEQSRLSTQSVICLPDSVDPRGVRGRWPSE
jgi:hypothetical protein